MKRFLPFGFVAVAAGLCVVAADDKPKPSPAGSKAAAPAKIAPAKPPPNQPPPAAAPKRSPDELAVSQTAGALVKTYNQRDGKAFAAIFTADGEYIDEKGVVFHGRQAIEDEFTRFFASNPGTSIEVQLSSTRAIAAAVIAADGATRFVRAKGEPAVPGRCHLVCTKEGGKWFVASLHEIEAADEHASHHEQVSQLEFLVGDWIDEGADSHVHFTCRWDNGQNFLVREFAVHTGGQKTMTGTQRIGYDPLTGHLRAWIFDSAGGYADGYFHRDGENWVLQTSGATSDGRMASGTQILSRLDNHRLSWQAVDYIIGGERMADIPKVTIVRKPPGPTTRVR